MFKKLNEMKKDKKGFTLVELIVVLVILAILMAVLIPALLGWIDKARNTQITTNANAALVAAQGLADEYYGTNMTVTQTGAETAAGNVAAIKSLTGITENFTVSVTTGTGSGRAMCTITGFKYKVTGGKTATWNNVDGTWTVN